MTGQGPRWGVRLTPTAERSLRRLPEKLAAAVLEFITRVLPTNPYRLSKPLRFELHGWRVARRGNYRIVFRIDDEAGVLHIGRIDHRGRVYH